jgi:hypothetical protein
MLLTGCQTTAGTFTAQDINDIEFNCKDREQNIAMLEAAKPSAWEQIKNGMTITSTGGWISSNYDGTLKARYQQYNGTTEAVRKLKIDQYKSNPCPK